MSKRQHHYLREIVTMPRGTGDPEGPVGHGWECSCGALSGLAFGTRELAATAHARHVVTETTDEH